MAKAGTASMTIADLRPAPYNPRTISDPKMKALANAMQRFGDLSGVVFNRRTGQLVGGHQRVKNLPSDAAITVTDSRKKPNAQGTVALGYIDVAGERWVYREVDWDAQTEAAANVAANKHGGEWDMKLLSDLLSELDGTGYDMELTGFDDEELARILAWTPDPESGLLPGADEEATPEPPADPVTVLGDVITLGRHRLMCGNATSFEHVETLLAGTKPQMAYCDPPYGVEIVSEAGTVSSGLPAGPGLRKGKVFDDSSMRSKQIIPSQTYAPIIGDDSTQTAIDAYNLVAALRIPTQIFWGGNYYAEALPPSSCWIVWDKDNGESFFADAELAWTNQKTAVRIFKHTWNGLIKASERGQRRVHPTQKPVALAEWCFDKYGEPGDAVVDLFGGSGSSLIAAEKTGRTAFLMERSEAYCDVIVTRWETATGQKAVRP